LVGRYTGGVLVVSDFCLQHTDLKNFLLRRVTYFINACGIHPSGRQSRSNAFAFVLRHNMAGRHVEQLC
jgi:hypothetical protein